MRTNQNVIRLVFWWIIPCKAISGLFRELAELPGYCVYVVCEGDLSEERKRLGWLSPEFGKAELTILSQDNWQYEVDQILGSSRDAIHIYNSVHAYTKIRYSLRKAIRIGIRTAVMTESLSNAFCGVKWLIKEVYTRTILPLRTRSLARHCDFVLCLSGNSDQARSSLRRLGWHHDKIFNFGYFSEQSTGVPRICQSCPPNLKVRLLCTGYLTRNKGQHILLQALSILKFRGIEFYCDITGYGPEEEHLRKLLKSLSLESDVTFSGVVSNTELDELLRRADIFVAPGLNEPWGIRINEALQAGLAVVMSDGIGSCELVRASRGGKIFPSGNYKQLAEVLASLISDPVQLAKHKESSVNYRQYIHPQIAAQYFDKVLHHKLNMNKEKPLAPWL